jgi:hypothetical protein
MFNFTAIDANDSNIAYDALKASIKNSIVVFLRNYQLQLDEPIDYTSTPAMILGQLLSNIDFKHEIFVLIDEYDQFTNKIFSSDMKGFTSIVAAGGYYRAFFEMLKQGAERGISYPGSL